MFRFGFHYSRTFFAYHNHNIKRRDIFHDMLKAMTSWRIGFSFPNANCMRKDSFLAGLDIVQRFAKAIQVKKKPTTKTIATDKT